MRNAKLLLINTLTLTLGAFIMRSVAVSFNVYLTNKIGTAGIGLLQLITSAYALAVTFSCAGIKLGATRLIADSLNDNAKSPMKLCIRYALSAGCLVSVIFYIFSGVISEHWIADKQAELSLKILSLSLVPVAVSASLSGYFTAKKSMVKYSSVQLAEQAVKIAVTIAALRLFSGSSTANACAAICFGLTFSEFFSAFTAYLIYRYDTRGTLSYKKEDTLFRKLLNISLPDVIGSGFRSVLLTVEHMLIPAGLKKSGQNTEQAMSTYGLIHAMALPIILYPSAILTSFSTMLVPELSIQRCKGNTKQISLISTASIKYCLLFAIGTAAFCYAFSESISYTIYSDVKCSDYIRILSVLIPIMYCDTVTDGLLKGLDQQNASMKYNIIDSAICVFLVYVLIPKYSTSGYIFILFISEILNFTLSISRLIRTAELKINIINDIIKPLISSIIACSFTKIICDASANNKTAILILHIPIFCAIYLFCLYALRSISTDEIKRYKSYFKPKVALD